jgi:uncharacterized protein (TIGR00725 family)
MSAAAERYRVLAVLGPAAASPELEEVAERVGSCAARAGWAVLTGGGPGVMAAASRGAAAEGGLTVGVLPVAARTPDYPNPWVRLVLFTGAGSARNAFNVLSAELCVAIGGGPGTLSEIALALKAGRELWCFRSWRVTPPPGRKAPRPRVLDDPEVLIRSLRARLEN